MKHKIITAVCSVAIAALTVAGAAAAQSDQVKASAQRAVAYAKAQTVEKQRADQVAKEYARVNALCHQQRDFYDAQSAAYHKANPNRPQCDLKIAE